MQDLSTIPHAPGVYLMRDRIGTIIYVGKALDLRKRLASYVTKRSLPPKIASLVGQISRLDYLISANEQDALVLENTLIKKYQPRYNTLLRDDKTYPYLVLTVQEDFPRLFLTRRRRRDGSRYYGPFTYVRQLRALIRWLTRTFGLRPCTTTLHSNLERNLKARRSCLYMHIRSCPAPCVGRVSVAAYRRSVSALELFLGGRHGVLLARGKREMREASKRLRYEEAGQIRDRIEGLERFYDRIRFRRIDESSLAVGAGTTRALSELKEDLGLKKVPLKIEAFDISNIGGEHAVGSMVRFINGKPDKAGYRQYTIRTVRGADDPRMLGEVVGRRFRRLTDEKARLPDLVLVDGGALQLARARAVLESLSLGRVALVGIAKKREEIFLPGRKKPLLLSEGRASRELLRFIRDEAHRFAINFYRRRHRKQLTAGRTRITRPGYGS